jgi:hypothetical protein
MITDEDCEKIANKMFGRGIARALVLINQGRSNQEIARFVVQHSPEAAEGFCSEFHGPFAGTPHNPVMKM